MLWKIRKDKIRVIKSLQMLHLIHHNTDKSTIKKLRSSFSFGLEIGKNCIRKKNK